MLPTRFDAARVVSKWLEGRMNVHFTDKWIAIGHVWDGSGWSAHLGDVGALISIAVVCIALATRVFRWE